MTLENYFLNARSLASFSGPIPQPGSIERAYAVQKVNAQKLGTIAGWKLGGTNEMTRNTFGCNRAYCGPIFENSILNASQDLSLASHIVEPAGELEVAIRLSDRVNQLGSHTLEQRNISEFVAEAFLSIELPWSVFPLPESGLNVLVADCCASGVLVLGGNIDLPQYTATDWDYSVAILGRDSVELASGRVSNILGGPLLALWDFLLIAQENSLNVQPGQIVATGGCCPCVSLPLGEAVTADFGQLGSFTFSIGR